VSDRTDRVGKPIGIDRFLIPVCPITTVHTRIHKLNREITGEFEIWSRVGLAVICSGVARRYTILASVCDQTKSGEWSVILGVTLLLRG